MEPEPVHIVKLFSDIISVIFLVAIFVIIKLAGKPYKRGIDCNDFSVNMTYKDSTVTNFHLILISAVMPIVFLLITEIVRYLLKKFNFININDKNGDESPNGTNKNRQYVKLRLFNRDLIKIREEFFNVYVNVGSFFFGLAATADITDFGKIIVGRLRPNFLGKLFILLFLKKKIR
jgi:hypothetical protein